MISRDHVLVAATAGELAVAVAAPAPQSAAEAAGFVAAFGGAAVVAVCIYLWGSLAPDLDHEGAVATAASAPAMVRSVHDGRLRPNPRALLRFLVPGSHTLSAVMRVLSRYWYQETRGGGDDPKARGTHRYLWHTGPGALVIAGVVAFLVSPAPGWIIMSLWGASQPGVAAWLAADPARLEVICRLVAAVPVALMAGVAGLAWNRSWKRWCMVVGFVAALATPQYATLWWLWAAAAYLGCYLHCVGDNCTEGGLPRWWAPFARHENGQKWAVKHYLPRWALVKTGGGGEAFLVLGWLGLWLALNYLILSARFVLGAADLFP